MVAATPTHRQPFYTMSRCKGTYPHTLDEHIRIYRYMVHLQPFPLSLRTGKHSCAHMQSIANTHATIASSANAHICTLTHSLTHMLHPLHVHARAPIRTHACMHENSHMTCRYADMQTGRRVRVCICAQWVGFLVLLSGVNCWLKRTILQVQTKPFSPSLTV